MEANFTGFSGRSPRVNISCSYAFPQKLDFYSHVHYPIVPNSSVLYNYRKTSKVWPKTGLSMDWRIGAVNCSQSTQRLACQNNSKCVDFDTTVGGYLCNCLEGYHGNPYLTPGCQGWLIIFLYSFHF